MYVVGYIVKVHTTRLYNKPIKHENWNIKRKVKLDFITVGKEGTYIWIGLGINLYSLKKRSRKDKKEQKKRLSYKMERSDAPVTFTK